MEWILNKNSFFNNMEVLIIAKFDSNELPINEGIKFQEVMVIGPNGEKMGLKNIKDALTLANYAGLDLVLMNGNGVPPVTKIMDYNKYRYELKEYRLSVTIDVGDFETRRKNAQEYLEKGHKIRAFIRFKGRQMARPELGKEVLLRFAEALSEVSIIETEPKVDGSRLKSVI